MTKADRIRTLYAAGKSVREICETVGCGDSYVRVAARQRKNGKQSECDRAYRQKMLALAARFGDYEAASKAGREAYAKKKTGGAWGGSYTCELFKSARRNAAAFAKS